MIRIVLNEEAASGLEELHQAAELCDSSGRVLGYFTPMVDRSEYEGINAPASDEELDRRSKEVGGYTTAEVLQHLEQLARREAG